MKIFCSYAYTGEDDEATVNRLRLVVDTLIVNGHLPYCNLFDSKMTSQSPDNIKVMLREALLEIGENDILLAIVSSPRKSIGQIMEIGVALEKAIPIYVLEHTSATNTTYLPQLSDRTFNWTTSEDLVTALELI